MIAEKLGMLAQMLASFAERREPLDATSVALVAHAIENMLPAVRVMEDRPVPPRFRVVQGGRDNAA